MGREPARRRPRRRVERRVDAADRAGILADERRAEAVDDAGHAPAAALVELGPADQPLVGGDLEEGIGVPARVGVEILELNDLHSLPPSSYFLMGCSTLTTRPKLCHGSRRSPTNRGLVSRFQCSPLASLWF